MVFQFLITKRIRTDCSITVSNGTIHKRNIVNIEQSSDLDLGRYIYKTKIAFETIYSVLRIQIIILKAYCVKVILFL